MTHQLGFRGKAEKFCRCTGGDDQSVAAEIAVAGGVNCEGVTFQGHASNLIENEFQFRGLNDPSIYKNENTRRLIANYISTFLIVADTLRRAGDLTEAERFVRMGLSYLPENEEAYIYLSEMFGSQGRVEELDSLLSVIDTLNVDRDRLRTNIA